MARTQVKLNNVYYKLRQNPTQTLANQMANKVGQGQSQYGDLTTWSAWIQEDWQEGAGKLKPHTGGGFLYGEADSRVPGQLILPPFMRHQLTDQSTDMNIGVPDFEFTVGQGGYTELAQKFNTHVSATVPSTTKFWIYASIPPGVTIYFTLYTEAGGEPDTTIGSAVQYTPPEENLGFYWHGVDISTATLAANETYFLAAAPLTATDSFQWASNITTATDFPEYGMGLLAGSWGLLPDDDLGALCFFHNMNELGVDRANTGAGFFRFDGSLWCYSDNRVYEYDAVNGRFELVNTITGITSVTSAVAFDDLVYFGNGGGDGDYSAMNTGGTVSDIGADGHIFAKIAGRLWRAVDNYVEYTEDGSTWEPTASSGSPVTVTDTSDRVTGMCGMGNKTYVATTAGLVPVHEGDIITAGHTWGSLHAQNGMRMVEHEGSIYICVNGRVTRFTEDGSMQDVWLTREDDVLRGRIGRVWDLCRMNNWLMALVGGTDAEDKPTIWAFQNNAWHHMATLPNSTSSSETIVSDYALYYDRTTSRLLALTPDWVVYSWYVPDYAINPYNDPDAEYMRSAWIEWDWFDASILEAQKDYESVTIIGENLSTLAWIDVYWKDDASTDWEYLGRADNNHEELRWSIDGGTRPNSRRLKLAFLMARKEDGGTPRLRAFRVKYHLMVRDWFRWNLQIDVSGRSGATQMLADGTTNTLTASQIKDALDALAKQVPPFVYQDVDLNLYEVKVLDGNFQYTLYEYNEATGDEWWEGVYSLVIEAVTQGEYTPPA